MKIAFRIGAMISIVVIISSLSVGFVMTSWFYTNAVEEKKKWAVSLSEALATSIARDTLEKNQQKLRMSLHKVMKENPDILYIYLLGFDGQPYIVLSESDNNLKQIEQHILNSHQHQTEHALTQTFDELGIIDVSHPLIKNLDAHLHLGFSQQFIEKAIGDVRNKAIYLILFILLLGIVASTIIAEKLSYPIVRLSRLANAFGQRKEVTDIADYQHKDEIGDLYRSFSEMVRLRNVHEKELNDYKHNLEQLVKRRTRELEDSIHRHELTEVSLIEAKGIAEEASRAKTEFLSNMSHELRTPLNAVLGFAQLIKTDTRDVEMVAKGVEQILLAGNHLLALINDVLDLSGIEAGKVDVTLESVDLSLLLDECLQMVSADLQQKNIRIDRSQLQSSCMVICDRIRLKQVLMNLLTNAIKYNRDDGKISFKLQDLGSRVKFSVVDTGVGIPESFKSQVFQAFSRLDKYVAVVEGTGVGLAITKSLMERMHGEIGFESTEGSGSEFWLIINRAGEDSNKRLERSLSGQELLAASLGRKFTVLYIEDNPASMLLIKKLLERYGNIEFIASTNPENGLDIARKELPDLIFLDINMPVLNGYQVKAILEQDESTRQIPVVAISANALNDDIEQAKQSGFDAYLTKPVDVETFYQVIYEFVTRSTTNEVPKP